MDEPLTAPPAPLTAPAAERPCQLYAHTSAPFPIITQGHHRFPEYLQRRAWGQVRDQDLLWVCGLCHDALHAVIRHMLGEGRHPGPQVGRKMRDEAQRTVDMFLREMTGR